MMHKLLSFGLHNLNGHSFKNYPNNVNSNDKLINLVICLKNTRDPEECQFLVSTTHVNNLSLYALLCRLSYSKLCRPYRAISSECSFELYTVLFSVIQCKKSSILLIYDASLYAAVQNQKIPMIFFTSGSLIFWFFCFFFLDCRDRLPQIKMALDSQFESLSSQKPLPPLVKFSVVTVQELYEPLNPKILENMCKFPPIEPNEKDIKEYMPKFGSIHCNTLMPNLATLSFDASHTLTIHTELEKYKQNRLPSFRCTYCGIGGGLHPHKLRIEWLGKNVSIGVDEQAQIPYDQFVVFCHNATVVEKDPVTKSEKIDGRLIYERTFAGFSKAQERIDSLAVPRSSEELSLAVLVLDSVARNQALRHLPRTVDFMRRLGFIWLDGYTKVGDNSAVNLLPVLTGRSILPQVGGDGSDLLPNSTIVDLESLEFIWDLYKKKGCVTSLNDDASDLFYGLFFYPNDVFNGFKTSPTDYFFRPYHVYNPQRMFNMADGSLCMKSGQPRIDEYLDLWEKATTIFKDKCHFSFNFLTELTHDVAANLGAIDERLRTSLERMFANGALENTALVIMGDHGNRIGTIQYTYVGRIEERMPYFSLYLPPKFRQMHPEIVSNFVHNKYRLTSNFDIHRTLVDLAQWGSASKSHRPSRGYSLLTERVPINRTCEDAGVPENFCPCLVQNTKLPEVESVKVNLISQMEQSLTKRLSSVMPCALTGALRVLSKNSISPYTISEMARLGVRHMTDSYELKNVNMNIAFFDFFVAVPINNALRICRGSEKRIVYVLARFRHYPHDKDKFVDLPTGPLVFFSKPEACSPNDFVDEEKIKTSLYDSQKFDTLPADKFCSFLLTRQ